MLLNKLAITALRVLLLALASAYASDRLGQIKKRSENRYGEY